MAAKGIKKLLAIARENVQADISGYARSGGSESTEENFFSRGLSSEGYNAGYRDALDDVLLALNGVRPNRNYWWEERE